MMSACQAWSWIVGPAGWFVFGSMPSIPVT
jgi:hypothetical protein